MENDSRPLLEQAQNILDRLEVVFKEQGLNVAIDRLEGDRLFINLERTAKGMPVLFMVKAIGGTPVIYAQRNECCGGYITLEDKAQAAKRSSAVVHSAKDQGADMIITACPLCLYNLKKNSDTELPVYYFTELLAEALGLKEVQNG